MLVGDPEVSAGATISAEGALVDGKGHCCHSPSETKKITFADALGWTPEEAPEKSRQRLRRRRAAAAKVLRNQSPRPQHEDQKRGRYYPVTACGTVPHTGGFTLEARASGRVDRHGIMMCGSVWTCPECAQRVATHRAIEIKTVIERARERGCRVEMMTFTLPHDLSIPAEECMRRIKEALRRFSSDGSMRRELKRLGFLGQVRSIEVTYGHVSGWHFHAHAVVVFDARDGEESTAAKEDFARSLELKKALYPGWKRAAHAAGAGTPNFKHGFDVRAVWSANDYIAKLPEAATAKSEAGKGRWGAEAELSKAYMKESRKSSRTPWEILDGAETNPEDAKLFRAYAAATWGRSQIEWSKGDRDLRKMFLEDAADKGDEELVYEEPEWVFADEEDLPDVGEDNIVVERIEIGSADAWRARRENFGSIDRACSGVERGDALSLAAALMKEGWLLEKKRSVGYSKELREGEDGCLKKHTVIDAAEFVARWPDRACSRIWKGVRTS